MFPICEPLDGCTQNLSGVHPVSQRAPKLMQRKSNMSLVVYIRGCLGRLCSSPCSHSFLSLHRHCFVLSTNSA